MDIFGLKAFDFRKMRAMEPYQTDDFLTVTELNRLASQALSERFGLVWLRAEIGTLTRASSGHVYLTLKDSESTVKAVMFRSRALLCDFEPSPGDAVLVQARVGLYEPRGDFQLNVQILRRDGVGSLHEQFLQLKAKLQKEGVFDAALKRAVPMFPRAIGIITSLAAAALHDVLTTLRRRAPHIPVIVYPASVQGKDAPLQLRQALAVANERQEVDVILLVRGGGSIEDLWAFNDESLAREIASSSIVTISGVGHESDVTIADFAADLRAATPTAAAELCCLPAMEVLAKVQATFERMQSLFERRIDRLAQKVDQLAYSLVSPSQRLARQAQSLAQLEHRLYKSRPDVARFASVLQSLKVALAHQFSRKLQLQENRLSLAQARIQALAPQATLERGYAIVRDATGGLVRDVAQLTEGDAFEVELSSGFIQGEVRKAVRK